MNEDQKQGLCAENIYLAYNDGSDVTFAVRGVSLDLSDVGFIGILGPSGSGKSSLLYLLSGLKRATSGEIYYNGRAYSDMKEKERLRLRRNHYGFVFQQPYLFDYLTAIENALTGASPGDDQALARAMEIFEELGIARNAKKRPRQLSGGERQRVCIARAMMNSPTVIFADEPTAALDRQNGHKVMEMLASYRNRGLVIVVTHDTAMLDECDRIYRMRDGTVQEN
jgi:putative ABC transport system ATP-binding protein